MPLAILRGVSHRTVETLIGRLATDASLRRRFAADPYGLLARLHADGHELTGLEIEALAATDAAALQTLADALDRRLRKAGIEVDRGPRPSIHDPDIPDPSSTD